MKTLNCQLSPSDVIMQRDSISKHSLILFKDESLKNRTQTSLSLTLNTKVSRAYLARTFQRKQLFSLHEQRGELARRIEDEKGHQEVDTGLFLENIILSGGQKPGLLLMHHQNFLNSFYSGVSEHFTVLQSCAQTLLTHFPALCVTQVGGVGLKRQKLCCVCVCVSFNYFLLPFLSNQGLSTW